MTGIDLRAEAEVGAGSCVDVEVVRDPDRLAELFPIWDFLLGSGDDCSIYISRAWVEPWWRHFGVDHRRLPRPFQRTTPHLLVARSGGRPRAIVPWIEVSLTGWGRMLVGIGQETADYGGALLGNDPDHVLPALLDRMEHELGRGRTVIDLARLHPDGRFLAALRDRFEDDPRYVLAHHMSTPYPYVDLAAQEDPERAVRRWCKRNDVTRRERRLAEHHHVTYDHHRPGRSGTDLAAFLDLHRRRWSAKADVPDGIFATAPGNAFLVDAAEALDRAGDLRISILRADGRPIAARFGTQRNGVYQGMKSAWDPDLAAFGLGHLAVGRVLRRLVDEGVGEMDMLRGAGSHKAAWATGRRIVSYWTLTRRDHLESIDRRAMMAGLRIRARSRR